MNCPNCGEKLMQGVRFCNSCGVEQDYSIISQPQVNSNLMGFSNKIKDPAFARYIKSTYLWSAIFSIIIAIGTIVGFYIAGESSPEMDNPESLYIGLGIGGVFIIIALFQIIGRKRSKTWDGIVEDKTIKVKKQRENYGDNNYNDVNYLEYTVVILSDQGKRYEISARNDETMYNYYNIGDKVRHHAGLNSYEKFDKSRDKFIPCNACASLNDIQDNYCSRCKCPLLK